MGRSKFIPSWFEKIHSKYQTPMNSVLFVLGFSLLAPWFGRPVLVWLTDTCALTAAASYFFACYTAYKYVCQFPDNITMPYAKLITITGSLISICSVLLLAIPGSPAVIGTESWILLVGWCIIGFFLYKSRSAELNALSDSELQFMLMGERGCPLLFKSKD